MQAVAVTGKDISDGADTTITESCDEFRVSPHWGAELLEVTRSIVDSCSSFLRFVEEVDETGSYEPSRT
jgi:hypothetical protein